MSALSRLSTALSDGLLTLPSGPATVMRPPPGFDLSGLDGHPLQIVQSFAPDHAAFASAGHEVSLTWQKAPTTLVVLPRSKALGRAMIAEAASGSEMVIVDGQKTDGADSHWRAVRKRLGDVPSITKAHGRLFWFPGTPDLSDWMAQPSEVDGMRTVPGVFSEDRVDAGSAALAAALPEVLPARMADLGAGWGWLSREVLRRKGVESLALVEAEALALDCARVSLGDDPRAAFHWADATRFAPATPFDGIVMNPPFHAGRAADPALGQAFIAAAARMLSPRGALWMVANRHLPYEAALSAAFRDVTALPSTGGFKIFHASRPVR